MERTAPINPERKANLFLKIWLYPNVSGFKIAKAIPAASNWRKNYHDRSFGFATLIGTEMLISDYCFPHMAVENFRILLIGLFLFHGLPELFFDKKITEMGLDYYSYYNKSLLYIFLVFLIIGFALLSISFYNEIGHVT